ncbi:MAG: hypothetical protein PHG31_04930, partial [Candidatus Omnitrophica bacterium]|nr:hypothetical protein [Candidatus Omnitrophota bacterium]
VFSERLISNVFSQATSNVSRVIVNRLSGVYNEKYGQDWFEIMGYKEPGRKGTEDMGGIRYEYVLGKGSTGIQAVSLDGAKRFVKELSKTKGSFVKSGEVDPLTKAIKDDHVVPIEKYVGRGPDQPGYLTLGEGEYWTSFVSPAVDGSSGSLSQGNIPTTNARVERIGTADNRNTLLSTLGVDSGHITLIYDLNNLKTHGVSVSSGSVIIAPQFSITATGEGMRYAQKDTGMHFYGSRIGAAPGETGRLVFGDNGISWDKSDASTISSWTDVKIKSEQDKSGVETLAQLANLDILFRRGVLPDWNLSYAKGEYSQRLGELVRTGEITGLGTTEYSNKGVSVASLLTLRTKGDFFVPELLSASQASTDGAPAITSTVPSVLTYQGRQEGNNGMRINLASGTTGLAINPQEIDTEAGKQNSYFDNAGNVIGSVDINSIPLSDFSKWYGVAIAERNKGALTVHNEGLLAYSTMTTDKGDRILSSIGINPNAAHAGYLSLGEHNAFMLQESRLTSPRITEMTTKLGGSQNIKADTLWTYLAQNEKGEFVIPDNQKINFGSGIDFVIQEQVNGETQWSPKRVRYQSTQAEIISKGVKTPSVFHYGIQDLSVIPQGLLNVASSSESSVTNLDYQNSIDILGQSKGVLATKGVVPAVLQADQDAGLTFQSFAEAGGMNWQGKMINLGTGNALDRENGGFRFEKGQGIHFARSEKDGIRTDIVIGGENKDTITFRRGGTVDALGLIDTTSTKGSFVSEPQLSIDKGVVETQADRIPLVARQDAKGEWNAVPQGRYDVQALDYNIQQRVNGGDWVTKPLVAQDTGLALVDKADSIVAQEGTPQQNIPHYLIKGLSFVEPGKAVGGQPSDYSYRLDYPLDSSGKIFSNAQGIITATDSLMPMTMALNKDSALAISPISMAKNLKYQFEGGAVHLQDGKVLAPQPGQKYAVTVTDTISKIPQGIVFKDTVSDTEYVSMDNSFMPKADFDQAQKAINDLTTAYANDPARYPDLPKILHPDGSDSWSIESINKAVEYYNLMNTITTADPFARSKISDGFVKGDVGEAMKSVVAEFKRATQEYQEASSAWRNQPILRIVLPNTDIDEKREAWRQAMSNYLSLAYQYPEKVDMLELSSLAYVNEELYDNAKWKPRNWPVLAAIFTTTDRNELSVAEQALDLMLQKGIHSLMSSGNMKAGIQEAIQETNRIAPTRWSVWDGVGYLYSDVAKETIVGGGVLGVAGGVTYGVGSLFGWDGAKELGKGYLSRALLFTSKGVVGDILGEGTASSWMLAAQKLDPSIQIITYGQKDPSKWEYMLTDSGKWYKMHELSATMKFGENKELGKQKWAAGDKTEGALYYGLGLGGQVSEVALQLLLTKKIAGLNIGAKTFTLASLTTAAVDELTYSRTGRYMTSDQQAGLVFSFAMPAAGAKIARSIAVASGIQSANTLATPLYLSRAQKFIHAGTWIPQSMQNWALYNVAIGHTVNTLATGRPATLSESAGNVLGTYGVSGLFQGLRYFASMGKYATPIIKALDISSNKAFLSYPLLGGATGLVYNRVITGDWFNRSTLTNIGVGMGVGLGIAGISRGSSWLASTRLGSNMIGGVNSIGRYIGDKAITVKSAITDTLSPFSRVSQAIYSHTFAPLGRGLINFSDLRYPLNFLAGSTAGAYIDFRQRLHITDANGNTFTISPLSQLGGIGYGLNALVSPGRTMLSALGNVGDFAGIKNQWSNDIAQIRSESTTAFLKSVNAVGDKIGGFKGNVASFMLASPVAVDAFLNTASGALQMDVLSNPTQFVKDFAQLWNLKNLINPNSNPGNVSAKGAEWGTLFWGLAGYSRGFRYNAGLIREATNAPRLLIKQPFIGPEGTTFRLVAQGSSPMTFPGGIRSVSMTLYDYLSPTQKFGYFVARTNEQASSFVKINTALALGLNAFDAIRKSGRGHEGEAINKVAYGLAYSMPSVASSAFGITASFNLLGMGYRKIVDAAIPKAIADSKLLRTVAGDYARIKVGGLDIKAGKVITPLVLTGTGALMYYAGEKMNSDIGNYIKIAGLASIGTGLWLAGSHIKNTNLFMNPRSWMNRVFGVGAEGWTKARYNIRYGVAGAAGGIAYGILKGDISGIADWKNLFYGGMGALAGMGFRQLPAIVPWTAEAAGQTALIFATKKGVFDPAIGAIEAGLNPYKTFNLQEATSFSLTPWERKHEILRYAERFEDLPTETREILKAKPEFENMTVEQITADIIDPKTLYLRDMDAGKYFRISRGETSDLSSALGYGLLMRAAIIGANAGYKSYIKGEVENPLGFGKGLGQAFRQMWERPSKIGSLRTWYEFGNKNPLVGIGTSGMLLGGASYGIGSLLKDEQVSDLFKTTGKYITAAGAITTAAGLIRAGFAKQEPLRTSALSKFGGASTAMTKAIAWDLGLRGTVGNLLFIIAPLSGAVETASLLSKRYLMPSAYSGFEYDLLDSTLGAFWITPTEASRYGDPTLASRRKYEDLLTQFKGSSSLADKFISGLGIAGRAYASGLYGQWQFKNDLFDLADEKNIKDYERLSTKELIAQLGADADLIINRVRTVAESKGFGDWQSAPAEDLISRLDGLVKVEHLNELVSLKDGKLNIDLHIRDVERSNVAFSLALAVLNPVAASYFTNIKAGDFGRKFQAFGHGWEEGLGSLIPRTVAKVPAAESKLGSRLYDFAVGGTAEELIPENVIQLGLNLVPLNVIMPNRWAQQFSEVAQEILTPNGHLGRLNHNDALRILRNGGHVTGINFQVRRDDAKGQAAQRAYDLQRRLIGKTWQQIEGDAQLLRDIGSALS